MVDYNPIRLIRSKLKSKSSHNEENYDLDTFPEPRTQNTALRRRSIASINFMPKKTWGWKIRDAVGVVESTLGPYLKKIFPSFIAVHYFYIISCAILGSILIYPVKTVRYIDALFFASGAATQAGLNTVDVNKLSLYQQIVVYIMCCLTTPIFIHSSLCFLRLYWFERYFDDIRETSKLHFKMRRTATMMARTQSMENSRTAESAYQNQGTEGSRNSSRFFANNQEGNNRNTITEQSSRTFVPSTSPTLQNGESPETKESDTSSSDLAPITPIPLTQSAVDIHQMNQENQNQNQNHELDSNSVDHISEPSSDDEERDQLPPDMTNIPDSNTNDVEDINEPRTTPNIKFADLPKPRKHDVEPRDVYMSISMLRNSQQKDTQDEENDGPALVISGPAEREKPVRQNSAIQFDLQDKPSHHHRRKHNLRSHRPTFSSFKFSNNRGNSSSGNNSVSEQPEIDGVLDDNISDYSNDEDHKLKKAQSNLQLPSSDQTGGTKFGKRSNTLDVANHKSSLLHKSPTFERMIRQKLKPKKIRRRLSSTAIEDSSSGSDTESDDDFDENSLSRHMSTNYLSWNPRIGRNSTFVNLSDQQKEELGGVEYRAVKLLSKILLLYYLGFHILGFIFLVPWIHGTKSYHEPVDSSGVTLTWWGFFTSMSAFNDLGFTLTPDSMNSFNTSIFALLTISVLVVIGNTGFPILLRFIIWVLFKFSRDLSLFKESLGFLLDHPRRCFTLLFPSAPTWWLLFILVVMNAIDLILFVILDLSATVVKALPVNIRVLDGFFQAISTRTAGFSCIDLSQLHPGVQVSYLVMMYISVLPLAISIRRTNVYEEQSLGVYAGHHEQGNNNNANNNGNNNEDTDNQNATSFIGAHLRKQLSFDLWFVFMGLFIICIAEGDQIKDASLPEFNVFQVLFEVVSAYGTVGLSLGYPNTTPSFSGQFNVISKLVIIAMMIRGRHRGLPYSLDRAIMLPSEKMEIRDRYQDVHAGNHMQRAETMGSVGDPVVTFFKNAAPNILRNRIKRPSFMSARSQSVRSNRENSYVSGYQSNNFSQPETSSLSHASIDNNNHTGFKDVHFNHQAPSNTDYAEGLAPHQTKESQELDDLDFAHVRHFNHDDQINDEDEDDESLNNGVFRAETFGGGELPDLGSRRNSNITL